MKKHRSSLILLALLISVLCLGVFSKSVVGITEDLDFNFIGDTLYNYPNDSYKNETFNLKDPEKFNGHYPATYSFENETIGTIDDSINWIYRKLGDDTNREAIIITKEDGHNKVINFTSDGGNGLSARWDFEPSDESEGTIELWYKYIDNGVGHHYFAVRGTGTNVIIYMYFDSADNTLKCGYGDGIGGIAWTSDSATADTWHHIKITFNCDTDKQSVWLNGILVLDENFYTDRVCDTIDYGYISMDSGAGANALECYADAIGYSWSTPYEFESQVVDTEFNTTISKYDLWNIQYSGANVWANISDINGIEGNYLNLIDNAILNRLTIDDNFTSYRENGTIEFDIRTSDNTERASVILSDESTIGAELVIGDGGLLFYWYSTPHTYVYISDFNNNQWYNVIMEFESDNINIYLDDVLLGNYVINTTTQINKLWFTTGILANSFNTSIDNIEYSWRNYYEIGDNLIPYYENTKESLLDYEIDRTEFTFENANDLYDLGDDNPSGWTDTEEAGDHAGIGADVSDWDSQDRAMKLLVDGDAEVYTGIEKDFTEESGVIDVSWDVNFTDTTIVTGSYFELSINSFDKTLIAQVGLEITSDIVGFGLYYYNGTGDEYLIEIVDSSITDNMRLEFRLLITSFCILNFSIDGVYEDTYYFEKIDPSKDGLGNINFKIDGNADAGHNLICYIDYVSVYVDGTSLSNDYGYHLQGLEKLTYYSWYVHNLFYIKANKEITILATSYDDYDHEDHTESICGRTDLSNGKMINTGENEYVWGWGQDVFLDGAIMLFSNEHFNVSEINIEGVYLTIDETPFYPVYASNNVNINESYFIADTDSNTLSFTLVCDDDNEEYMSVSFELFEYYQGENGSMYFKSNINGFSKGFVGLNNTDDTSMIFGLPTHQTTTNTILNQDKTFWQFFLLITDNDEVSADSCAGYIKSVSIVYYPDIDTIITTLTLLAVIVPLIMLIVPTFALYKRFGESVIVPTFVLMSIICFATNMIPAWLFVIIIAGSFGFLVMKKQVGGI